MAITDGDDVSAANVNAAFMSRTDDTSTLGKVDLSNAAAASGGTLTNSQRNINSLFSFIGGTSNNVYNYLPTWTNNDVGLSTDPVKLRVDNITLKFNATTGHKHSGAAGDAPLIPLSTGVTGTLPNANTTAVTTATASTIVARDIQANTLVNNITKNFATTATAAATTTLTGASAGTQQFTGTTTQSVKLPDATLLTVGFQFLILNRSTGSLTIKDNGSNSLQTMVASTHAVVTCTSVSTTNGLWDFCYTTESSAALSVSGGGTGQTSLTAHDLLIGNGTSGVTLLAPGATSGVPLISQGSSADPAYGTAVVAGGGTGAVTFTAYAVLCAGTTATGVFQNVSGVGTSGQVLTSNGASALPTWQDAAASTFPSMAAYTPTLTGVGTATSVNCRYLTWGNLTFVQFSFVSGTSTATEMRMTLPNSLTSKNDYPATQQCGNFCYDASSSPQGIVLIEASVQYFTFGLQAGSSGGSSKGQGSAIVGSGTRITGWAWVQTS